jgi:hypothetical protein
MADRQIKGKLIVPFDKASRGQKYQTKTKIEKY